VIVHINHISASKKPSGGQRSKQSELAGLVAGSMLSMVEDGVLDVGLAPTLRVHLDWIQYKTNFRDPVVIRRTTNPQGHTLPLAEIAVDLRQADAASLQGDLARAVRSLTVEHESNQEGHLYLDGFRPYRECLIWSFNRLFWQHLGEWESASGKDFEKALPGGSSDANHPQAVADSVTELRARLRDLDTKGRLPTEIVGLEIGPGSGQRAVAWMDCFKALDQQEGTRFYDRLQFILGDYSPASLARALAAVSHHGTHVTGTALDALNPFKALPRYRFKVMYVHMTNVYDNLPFDDLVRRDGKLYIVEVRPYLNGPMVDRLLNDFPVTRAELPAIVKRLLEGGPGAVFSGAQGIAFWRRVWETFKLEERLRVLDEREEDHVPPGLTWTHLEDLLAEAPDDVRFHVSRGAGESFVNTLPLLHPRGYLHVQDLFVSDMDDYRRGFRGPGKLDGSLVVWVNGALLRAVAARSGYDVHFAPFPYRPGTKTTIMYTTQRD
jgi:hypothetical protein